jgi:hypothetical protein
MLRLDHIGGISSKRIANIAETAFKKSLSLTATRRTLSSHVSKLTLYTIEAITQTTFNAANAVLKIIKLESGVDISASQSAVTATTKHAPEQTAATKASAAPTKQQGKDQKTPNTTATKPIIAVAIAVAIILAHCVPHGKIVTHNYTSLYLSINEICVLLKWLRST